MKRDSLLKRGCINVSRSAKSISNFQSEPISVILLIATLLASTNNHKESPLTKGNLSE
ncbi:hypothetical protein ACFLY2_02100 [Patescibacteria group bacterium]